MVFLGRLVLWLALITLVAACDPGVIASPGLSAPALVVPACPGDVCTEGVAVGDRFYALFCRGVDPDAVLDEVVASGSGTFEEARSIEGLPPELWLAVSGDLPCRPASNEPLEYDWYLLEYEELTIEQRQQYLDRVNEVATEF